jgi:hypothetical protein
VSRFGKAGLVLVAAGAGLLLWPRDAAPLPPFPGGRLLADTGGPVTLAVGSVVSARRSALRNAATVSNIVNALPARARLLLLANDRAAFTIARDPAPGRVAFVELPGDTPITIWPQDPFLVLRRDDGASCLLASREFPRAGDRAMARALADHLGWPHAVSGLDFEGGNIVADERRAFVGAETIRANAVRLEVDDADVARRFERELGLPVLVVGPLPQPVGHIDMVLTPLGAGRLALADPGRGAEIAERELEGSPAGVEAFERACEAAFFGIPGVRVLRDPDGKELRAPPLVGATKEAASHCRSLAAVFDRLAEDLRREGYSVVRVPFLAGAREAPREAVDGERPEDGGGPGYPTLTYNNVLLEEGRVYLARYGLEALDSAARRVFEEQGFEARPVDGLAVSAMYGGSLRCNVKVLARG